MCDISTKEEGRGRKKEKKGRRERKGGVGGSIGPPYGVSGTRGQGGVKEGSDPARYPIILSSMYMKKIKKKADGGDAEEDIGRKGKH